MGFGDCFDPVIAQLGHRLFVMCKSDAALSKIQVYTDTLKHLGDIAINEAFVAEVRPNAAAASAGSNGNYLFISDTRNDCIWRLSLTDYTLDRWVNMTALDDTGLSATSSGGLIVIGLDTNSSGIFVYNSFGHQECNVTLPAGASALHAAEYPRPNSTAAIIRSATGDYRIYRFLSLRSHISISLNIDDDADLNGIRKFYLNVDARGNIHVVCLKRSGFVLVVIVRNFIICRTKESQLPLHVGSPESVVLSDNGLNVLMITDNVSASFALHGPLDTECKKT